MTLTTYNDHSASEISGLELTAQDASDIKFLEALRQCVANGGSLTLTDRFGVEVGTFQRPEEEDEK